jgi:hypothetical protein
MAGSLSAAYIAMAGSLSAACIAMAGSLSAACIAMAGSLTAAAMELARYELDLVGVQEVSQDKVGTFLIQFFLWKRKQESSIGNRIFCAPQE